MKIHEISDLHLEGEGYDLTKMPEADVLILAGDIVRVDRLHMSGYKKHFDFWCAKYKHVIVIDGNHEYYRSDFNQVEEDYKAFLASILMCHRLDNMHIEIDGVLFIGSTMWTNFLDANEVVVSAATKGITDFHIIGIKNRNFLPMDAYDNFTKAWQFINNSVEVAKDTNFVNRPRKIVVITHFCPSKKSIHPKWGDNPVNHYFASNCEDLMGGVDLWFHGHTHSSFDYNVGDCRVVCNPKGYGKENASEFDPQKVIEI